MGRVRVAAAASLQQAEAGAKRVRSGVRGSAGRWGRLPPQCWTARCQVALLSGVGAGWGALAPGAGQLGRAPMRCGVMAAQRACPAPLPAAQRHSRRRTGAGSPLFGSRRVNSNAGGSTRPAPGCKSIILAALACLRVQRRLRRSSVIEPLPSALPASLRLLRASRNNRMVQLQTREWRWAPRLPPCKLARRSLRPAKSAKTQGARRQNVSAALPPPRNSPHRRAIAGPHLVGRLGACGAVQVGRRRPRHPAGTRRRLPQDYSGCQYTHSLLPQVLQTSGSRLSLAQTARHALLPPNCPPLLLPAATMMRSPRRHANKRLLHPRLQCAT